MGRLRSRLVGAALHARGHPFAFRTRSCHYLCADAERRATLHTDAGGDDLEECAVCYLSILLADELPGFGRARMLADMDAWGYSFRLGTAHAWFTTDAADARAWLHAQGLIDARGRPCAPAARGSPCPR